MDSNYILHITALRKTFDSNDVLQGVDLQLGPNENLVILGRSGSGKSVLMKCAVRLIEPDSGYVEIFNEDVLNCTEQQLNTVRTRMGYLFQGGALYDSMTLRENLLFPVERNERFKNSSEVELEELVRKNLSNVGLLEAVDQLPGALSGGMKKRAALARTLMLSPEIIFYDEPTTGLDTVTSKEISHLMLKIKNDYGTPSVTVTHDMQCAKITADRILVLHKGNFIAEGTFDSLQNHENDQVKNFFIT
jgi:phospholipid/cholesterol/gamma-HCH transport system ATP-binding protein